MEKTTTLSVIKAVIDFHTTTLAAAIPTEQKLEALLTFAALNPVTTMRFKRYEESEDATNSIVTLAMTDCLTPDLIPAVIVAITAEIAEATGAELPTAYMLFLIMLLKRAADIAEAE